MANEMKGNGPESGVGVVENSERSLSIPKLMKFFQEQGTRDEFFIKLKQMGENSNEVKSLNKIILSLGMNKTSRHVHQTTILQNTFKHCEPLECFTNLRLVCKSWNFAVKTMPRFDHIDVNTINLISEMPNFDYCRNLRNLPVTYRKTIQSLKNVKLDRLGSDNYNELANIRMISRLAVSLESFSLRLRSNMDGEDEDEYLDDMGDDIKLSLEMVLRDCNQTLKSFNIPTLVFPSDLRFSNLIEATICLDDESPELSFSEFKTGFQNLIRCSPNIKIINLGCNTFRAENILTFLGQNYGKHCGISYPDIRALWDQDFANYVPVKIIKMTYHLDVISKMRYANQIEYIWVGINMGDKPWWRDFKSVFSVFTSLKGIYIMFRKLDRVNDRWLKSTIPDMELMGEKWFKIWEENMQFIKTLGIEILSEESFNIMDSEICKSVPWKINFHVGSYLYGTYWN